MNIAQHSSFRRDNSPKRARFVLRLAFAAALGIGLCGALAWAAVDGRSESSSQHAASSLHESELQAGSFSIDPVHSSIGFRIDHLGVSHFYGRFNDVSGSFTLDSDDPASSSLSVEVKAASIDTHNANRNADLKGPDFFDVANFPTINFKADSFTKIADGQWKVAGNLTLHGVTKPLTVTLDKVGEGNDPWGGYRKGVATEFSIKRSDFGMKYMLGGVGDEVTMTICFEAVQKKN